MTKALFIFYEDYFAKTRAWRTPKQPSRREVRFLRFVPTPVLDFRTSRDTNARSLKALALREQQFTSASGAKLTGRNIPSSESPPSWLYQRRPSARTDNSEYSGTRNIAVFR
jgi:hypothetical protein